MPRVSKPDRKLLDHPDTHFRWLETVYQAINEIQDNTPGGAAVLKSLFDANTVLKADTDNIPEALTVGEQTLVGRITGGEIAALTPSQTKTLLDLVIGTDVLAFDTEVQAFADLSHTNGDVYYYNSGVQRLAKGSDGEVLTLASGIPSWAAAAGGGTQDIKEGGVSVVAAATSLNFAASPFVITDEGSNVAGITVDGVLADLDTLGAPASDGQIIVATGAGAFAYESGATARTSLGAQAQGDVLDDLNTLGANSADSEFLVGTGAGALAWESGATVRTSLGLAIGTDVQAYDADLAAFAALSHTNGDIYYYNTGVQRLAKGTDGQVLTLASGLPSWAAASGGGGGLTLESTDTADGTAEFLQVTSSETLADIKRMEISIQSIRPEIDGDTLTFVFILDDDSELTGTAYDRHGWFVNNGGALTVVDSTGDAGLLFTLAGNATGENFSAHLQMISENNALSPKSFIMTYARVRSDTGVALVSEQIVQVDTTKRIKGGRLDSDNAGDMINLGTMILGTQV